MKRKGMYFLAGVLSVLAIILPSASALASDGSFTITVHPIDILVNGEVFRPENANGNSVMTFSYNGTSYAPVRALAEEYGLEVGYDPVRNTATVSSPTGAVPTPTGTAEDFASQWTVAEKPVTNYGDEKIFTAKYSGSLGMGEFKEWWKSMSEDDIHRGAEALAAEYQKLVGDCRVTMYFTYGAYNLGTAHAVGDFEQSNFTAAGVWIK